MKKAALLLISVLLCVVAYSQHQINGKGFSYQGYARNSGGTALASTGITVRFSISLQGSGTVVFTEEHALTTDAFGVFYTAIGTINSSDYGALAFDRNNYQMKVEVKTSTTNYTTLSSAELLAVPYAKAAGNGVPPGTILPFAGETPPRGYLLCDGNAISKTAYPALFDAIGNAWGGDGTNFNVPDLRGTFLRGVDTRTSGGNDPDAANRTASNNGGNTGAKVGSLQNDELKAHDHSITIDTTDILSDTYQNGAPRNSTTNNFPTGVVYDDNNITASGSDNNGTQNDEFNVGNFLPFKNKGKHTHTATIHSAGGNETRPRNAAVLYIIKY